MSVSHFPEPQQ